MTRFYLIAALLTLTLRGELVPPDRLHPWVGGQTVGVPGGIIHRTTIVNLTNLVDTTGVTNASTVINSAIASAAAGSVILLPSTTNNNGFIRLNSGLIILRDNITLRGAGMSNTVLKLFNTVGIYTGSNPDYQWNWPPTASNRCNDVSKGSSNIVLTGITPDSTWTNKILRLTQTNDWASDKAAIQTMGYERVRQQMFYVVGVSGSTLTVWPPSVMTFTNHPTIALSGSIYRFNGVEDLTISCTNSSVGNALNFYQTYGCWARDVKVVRSASFASGFGDSILSEFRRVWIDKNEVGGYPGPNHAGIGVGRSTGIWIEDCIIDDEFPCIEVNSAAGNAFSYNFVTASFWGGAMNDNHNAHSSFNLYEGNVGFSFQSDGYFGSSEKGMLHRNWVNVIYGARGTAIDYIDQQNSGFIAIKLNRFAYDYSVIGNVLGNSLNSTSYHGLVSIGKPNIGNEGPQNATTAYAPPWTNSQVKLSAAVTMSISGTNVTASSAIFASTNVNWWLNDNSSPSRLLRGLITSVTSSTLAGLAPQYSTTAGPYTFVLAPGPDAWQQIQTNLGTIFKGNHFFSTQSPTLTPLFTDPVANPNTDIDTPLGGDTIPTSYIYGSKPSFLSAYNWPPISWESPPSGNLTNNLLIPAMARYYSSASGGGGGSTGGGVGGDGRIIIRGGVNLRVGP